MIKISVLFLVSVIAVSAGPRRASSSNVVRDSNGRIARSSSVRQDFLNQTGYPKGRPGYVVDHVVPLYRGGADKTSNMQWQAKAAARAKDKIE